MGRRRPAFIELQQWVKHQKLTREQLEKIPLSALEALTSHSVSDVFLQNVKNTLMQDLRVVEVQGTMNTIKGLALLVAKYPALVAEWDLLDDKPCITLWPEGKPENGG